jgi:hypothetical protein
MKVRLGAECPLPLSRDNNRALAASARNLSLVTKTNFCFGVGFSDATR